MVGELDGKKMIRDTRQKLNHGHLRATVLGAYDQVRKVNEDELRPEGSEGVWRESILGRGNSMCKDPEAEMNTAHLRC